MLILLGSLLVGGIIGSLVDVERRLEDFGGWLRSVLSRGDGAEARFIEGFVTASLVFCVGPLTILGSLSDGLGLGADQLFLKATLDGFAAIAFAASLGFGVMASAIAVAVTAVGGLLLVGVGLRLRLKLVPVGTCCRSSWWPLCSFSSSTPSDDPADPIPKVT